MVKTRILYQKKRKKAVKNRYKLQIASTLFAILIWFLVVSGGVFEYTTTIPISVSTKTKNYIITNNVPQKAKIRIRGQGIALLTFLMYKEAHLVPQFSWETGKKEVNLTKEDISLTGNAKNLTLLDLVEPKKLLLKIEQQIQTKVPIKPEFIVKTQPGYTLVGDINISPAKATISGPKSSVDSIQYIETVTAKFENLKHSLETKINLKPPNDKIVLLTNNTTIQANVQKLMEKRLTNISVTAINLPPNRKAIIVPSTVSLIVEGGVNVLFPITKEDIEAYIDYAETIDQEKKDFVVKIKPIPQVRFREIDPERVKLILEKN